MLDKWAKWPYPRHITAAIGGSVAIVLIVSIIILFTVLRPHPSSQKPIVQGIPATVTSTSAPTNTVPVPTATPEPTATPLPVAPTATPIPHPLPVPQNAPPPSHNIVLPPPTATPVPPTAVPPTQTAATTTPCASTAPCPTSTVPPPPPPTATPSPCQAGGAPYYITPVATPTRDVIQTTLTDAANANGIPPALLEAIAWQESGWQINVVACDGGIGIMQVMPTTATWLNQYYGTTHDPHTLTGGSRLGAGYLAYFYRYYTNYVQRNYPSACPATGCNWDTLWPGTTDNSTIRDIVISVYNEGAGTMGKYGIINWSYVSSVLNFYHNRYGGQGS